MRSGDHRRWLAVPLAIVVAACEVVFPYDKTPSDGAGPIDAREADLQDEDAPFGVVDVGPEADALVDVDPEADALVDVSIDEGSPGGDIAVDVATPPVCLEDPKAWTSAVQCPVFYTCCSRCVDSLGTFEIKCQSGGCTCSLNNGKNAMCSQSSCDAAVSGGCCNNVPNLP